MRFIYRGDVHEANAGGVAQLLLAKQRNGPTAEVRLLFRREFARFEELAPEYLQLVGRRGIV